MKKATKSILAISMLAPLAVFAQLGHNTVDLIEVAGDIVEKLILLVAAVALLVFFWGLMKFIFKVGGDEGAVEQGRNLMKWGLIALFVMVSVWGIIRFFQGELNIDNMLDAPDFHQIGPHLN